MEGIMLTLLHPEIFRLVQGFPAGLLAVKPKDTNEYKLIVKSPKEALLAAKISSGFKIYICPLAHDNEATFGLITAFFDDQDEPLTLTSPLFKDDPHSTSLKALLLQKKIDVHLFDEHSHELLGFSAEINCSDGTREVIRTLSFLPGNPPLAKKFITAMSQWFSYRNAQDDIAAISIQFGESLIPDDLVFMDLREDISSYLGSLPGNLTQLEREEPGPFQERDIARLLLRIFKPEQIYLNPRRITDGEEIVDVLVVSDENALFIQAKDSPNIERILRNSIDRKKATTVKSLKKAITQADGALKYAKSMSPMELDIEDIRVKIPLENLSVRSLVIVKELFMDEFSVYSPLVLALANSLYVAPEI
jgi:hypothetical protein